MQYRLEDIVNATQHDVTIYQLDKRTPKYTIKSRGLVRLITKPQKPVGSIEDIPIYSPQEFVGVDDPNGLLNSKVVLVSMPTGRWLASVNHPRTVLGVDSGTDSVVVDLQGRTIGATRLVQYC
jgi:hypothetical protein